MKDDLRVKAWCIVSSDNCCVSLSLVSESDAWDRVCFTNGDRLSEGVLRQCGWKCVRVWLSRREEEESEIHPALHAYLAGKCIAVFTDRSYAEQFVRTFDFTPNQVTLVEVLPTEQPTTVEGFVAWHPEHGVRPATEDGGVFLAEDVELHTFSRSDKRQGWKPRRATLVLGEVEK